MINEEVATERKYTNWNVWYKGEIKNVITFVPMTPEQARSHFKADSVQGLEEVYQDGFGQYVNSIEAKVS